MRKVLHTATGPVELRVGNKTIKICRCGLSKDASGLCDKSCHATYDENEKKVYIYQKNGRRFETTLEDHCQNCGCEFCLVRDTQTNTDKVD